MKRRVDDQELVFAPQQQQSRRPAVQSIAESFQQRTLVSTPAIIEAVAENMQPSTGIQYSLSHSYQVWVGLSINVAPKVPRATARLLNLSIKMIFNEHSAV